MTNTPGRSFAKILCGFGLMILLVTSLGCAHYAHQGLLPRDVVGAWTTDDPRYSERAMELSRAFVIIVTGRHDPATVQMIDRVESEPKGSGTLFTIYSTDYSDGNHFEMKLEFNPANGGEIRFKNQSAVWKRRVETSSKPAPSRNAAKSR